MELVAAFVLGISLFVLPVLFKDFVGHCSSFNKPQAKFNK